MARVAQLCYPTMIYFSIFSVPHPWGNRYKKRNGWLEMASTQKNQRPGFQNLDFTSLVVHSEKRKQLLVEFPQDLTCL